MGWVSAMACLLHAELGLSVPRGGKGAEPSSAWKTTSGKRRSRPFVGGRDGVGVCDGVLTSHAELGLSVPRAALHAVSLTASSLSGFLQGARLKPA
jgi:hypothetical protein